MQWRVDPEGTIQAIYEENFDFTRLGEVQIRRASQVEPEVLPREGETPTWCVDLRQSGGPILTGFHKRSEAIQAEIRWITKHRL